MISLSIIIFVEKKVGFSKWYFFEYALAFIHPTTEPTYLLRLPHFSCSVKDIRLFETPRPLLFPFREVLDSRDFFGVEIHPVRSFCLAR